VKELEGKVEVLTKAGEHKDNMIDVMNEMLIEKSDATDPEEKEGAVKHDVFMYMRKRRLLGEGIYVITQDIKDVFWDYFLSFKNLPGGGIQWSNMDTLNDYYVCLVQVFTDSE